MIHLFFDDDLLFGRENVKRVQGTPQYVGAYCQEGYTADMPFNFVFRTDDGMIRMLYEPRRISDQQRPLLMAKSEDGIHFEPEDTKALVDLPDRIADNQVFPLPAPGDEIADIYDDPMALPGERYKLLLCRTNAQQMRQDTVLFTSPDLYHWKEKEGVSWGVGNEPLAGVFYNEKQKCNTILLRPFWGTRRSGYIETRDWKTHTPFQHCMRVDALDEPQAEIYGMNALPYRGMYVGFVQIYHDLQSCYRNKYWDGRVDVQLAYSYDGRYWQRGLREFFISNQTWRQEGAKDTKLHWIPRVIVQKNGDLLLYSATSQKGHGLWDVDRGGGEIRIYRLRKDGFVWMETEDKQSPSMIRTREKLWHGGDMHINLQAGHATVVVLESKSEYDYLNNLGGLCKPVEGFGHEDCIPFAGDSIDWAPQYKSGRTMEELKGKTLVFEICFQDGRLYSLEGNCTHLSNIEAAHYRTLGDIPETVL